jgi:hypothetical protein
VEKVLKAAGVDRGAMSLMLLTVVLWAFSWVAMKHLASLIGPSLLLSCCWP